MVKHLCHITSENEWTEAVARGEYRSKSFETESFIHCSYAHQVLGVAERLFGGRTDLVLLVVDPSQLSCKVVEENLEGGEKLFPHVYGPLPLDAVVKVLPFPPKRDGGFLLPCGIDP